MPSSFTGSPPYIGDTPVCVSSTCASTHGFSVNAWRGFAICSGSVSSATLPSYVVRSSSNGVTTSKRVPPASNASLFVIFGPVEHERDAAVGEVQARRELGVALVGAVAEAEEPADPLASGRRR